MLKEKSWCSCRTNLGSTERNRRFDTKNKSKKAAKLKADKDFYLGLGWLLREDKVETSEVEGEVFVKLV